MKKLIFKILTIVGISLSVLIFLSFGVKGQANNLNYYQETKNTQVGGPFEASNSTSRYALTESIVNSHSFLFDSKQTAFAAPDVVIYNGKAFTIFTPGVSFVAAPFYYLGKLIKLPQITAYSATLLFAIINTILVYFLARRLNASWISSVLSAGIFLFATNALPYAFGLTQHHFSLTVILLAILNAIEKRTWASNILLGIYFGAAILFDIPNALMLVPVGFYVLAKHFEIKNEVPKISFKFKTVFFVTLLGLLPFIFLFGVFNHDVTGSYTKIGQTIGRADFSKTLTKSQNEPGNIYEKKLPFNPRNEIVGLYTLLISDERSWAWYSPVLLLGALGALIGYKNSKIKKVAILLISIVTTNIIIYSMFGDPWGGWAFGPRYLIPSAGVLSVFVALTLDKYRKHLAFVLIFFILAFYSIYINVLGMMTTTSIPPKQEAEALIKPIPYTYQYNINLAETNNSGSYLYTTYLQDTVDLKVFILEYSSIVFLMLALPYLVFWWREKEVLWI